jgi:hypothetical protein
MSMVIGMVVMMVRRVSFARRMGFFMKKVSQAVLNGNVQGQNGRQAAPGETKQDG